MLPISNSELTTFRRCPRQHALTYGRSLVPLSEPPPYAATELGSAIHAVLESVYRDGDTAALDALEQDDSRAGRIVYFTTLKYLDWVESTGIMQGRTIIQCEATANKNPYIGKIDRIDELEDGRRVIVDYKTTGMPPPRKAAELAFSTQPLHYAWLTGIRDVEFHIIPRYSGTLGSEWDELRVEVVNYHFSRERLDAYEHHLRLWTPSLLRNRERGQALQIPEITPSPAADCAYMCPFTEVCLSGDEDSATMEFMLNEAFAPGDVLARYGRDVDE